MEIAEALAKEEQEELLETINGKEQEAQEKIETLNWPEPEKIKNTLRPVEKLPPDIIPAPFRDWVADTSHRMQCPIDFTAIAVEIETGAVIGAGCGIRPKRRDDWLVVPNLWGGIVGRPGKLKTPALQEALKPMSRLESEAKQKFDEEMAMHEANKEAYKAQKEALKNEMMAVAKGKEGRKLNDIKAEFANLEEPDPPTWQRFRTNDATIEKMAELLNQNPKGILLFRDELVGLLTSWDKEGRETDRAFYLEAWNGHGSITTDRIGRGTIHVDNLCISLLGGIQPAKLLSYLYQATSELENDGLIQRLQLMVYPDEPGDWKLVDEYPDKKAKDRAFKVIKNLSEIDFAQHGANVDADKNIPYFHFDSEAQDVFYKWLQSLEEKLQTDDSPVILEHLNKYRSLMPSLALIDHLVNIADGVISGGPVKKESAEKAAAWCEYLESHARRIYGLVGDIEQRAAAELAKKIKGEKLKDGFTIRDVYRNQWHLLGNKETVKAACDELIEAGWLREEITGERKTKKVYYINPRIFT